MLATFYLDEGTYSFCDDVQDLVDPTTSPATTYIGASALAQCANIVSSKPFSAESCTITCDGTRMLQSGFTDPAILFRTILTYELHQRRVVLGMGISYPGATNIGLVVQLYSGKINNAQVVDQQVDIGSISDNGGNSGAQLIITLDSLAARYQDTTSRVRNWEDQLEIDPTDNFFKFVNQTVASERVLYWGVKNPPGTASTYQTSGVATNLQSGTGKIINPPNITGLDGF